MIDQDVKEAARFAMDEVLDGRCTNQVQENFRLRFISASAKYLRAIRDLEYARSNPSLGFPCKPIRDEVRP